MVTSEGFRALSGSRVLTASQAAKYVGCKNARQFRREVGRGIWPAPIARFSRPQRWSKHHLDRAMGALDEAKDPQLLKLEQALGMS